MRAEEQAILVGTNTALNDNPSLTVRNWTGENPFRIVLDKNAKIPVNYNLLDAAAKTIVFSEVKHIIDSYQNIIFERIDFSKNVPEQICKVLYNYEIQSIIIEGGKQTLQSFIAANLWDEANVFIGAIKFNEGLKAPELKKAPIKALSILNDTLNMYKNY
jgi:diaminohydroxyphosphoribosylaminopyrimidine deaminase/5-amino-6-(5-phosphoribosylamino)uracil reductase